MKVMQVVPNLEFNFTMPWPPSSNRYWRHVGNVTIISREAREYISQIKKLAYTWNVPQLSGKVELLIYAFPPDNRRRDIDNLTKITIDALEEAGLFIDDSQIEALYIKRMPVKKNGYLEVRMYDLDGEFLNDFSPAA